VARVTTACRGRAKSDGDDGGDRADNAHGRVCTNRFGEGVNHAATSTKRSSASRLPTTNRSSPADSDCDPPGAIVHDSWRAARTATSYASRISASPIVCPSNGPPATTETFRNRLPVRRNSAVSSYSRRVPATAPARAPGRRAGAPSPPSGRRQPSPAPLRRSSWVRSPPGGRRRSPLRRRSGGRRRAPARRWQQTREQAPRRPPLPAFRSIGRRARLPQCRGLVSPRGRRRRGRSRSARVPIPTPHASRPEPASRALPSAARRPPSHAPARRSGPSRRPDRVRSVTAPRTALRAPRAGGQPGTSSRHRGSTGASRSAAAGIPPCRSPRQSPRRRLVLGRRQARSRRSSRGFGSGAV